MQEKRKYKTITITFCGVPNVGKSTLLNRLINCKLAICSPKPQTTRFNIRGILTKDDTQIVFIDTPGIFCPKHSDLEKQIVKEAWRGFCDAELICLIIDAKKGLDSSTKKILEKTSKNKIPMLAIINKSDLLSMDEKILLAEKLSKTGRFIDIFSLSALTGKGCNELLKYLFNLAHYGEWMYDEDAITDKDSDFLASEFVREQLFILLSKEIPYMLSCETEFFEDNEKDVAISVVVKVGKPNHKKIILGSNGCNLKKIIRKASLNLEKLLDKSVNLKLFIKL